MSTQLGSEEWLIATEKRYGGYVRGVKRRKISPLDPRTKEQLQIGGHVGGDRMSSEVYHCGYGRHYAEYLGPFIGVSESRAVVEVGILKGSGVAVWSDLFPSARVLGLDIDLSNVYDNMDNLRDLGAFKNDNVELYIFDQFMDNTQLLSQILAGDKISICIDDGCHSDSAVLSTLDSMTPHLANTFAYFIEDNATVSHIVAERYPQWAVAARGELTIITPPLCT